MLGGICALLNQVPLTAVTLGALAAFLWQGYRRASRMHMGVTTEFAVILVFWLGYLVREYELVAVSTGIVLTILLALKRQLHDFVAQPLTEREFYDTLKFLVVVSIVFPLLPNRGMGPWDFFNPTEVWLLVILVSSISYGGYLAIRLLGSRRGLGVLGLVGGVVSTTAVTM